MVVLDDPDPDWIDTEGPFGPMLVEPLSPPGPVLIVVEFGEDAPLCDGAALPLAAPFWATRHGLLLSMTIVVPPLSPVLTVTLTADHRAVDADLHGQTSADATLRSSRRSMLFFTIPRVFSRSPWSRRSTSDAYWSAPRIVSSARS